MFGTAFRVSPIVEYSGWIVVRWVARTALGGMIAVTFLGCTREAPSPTPPERAEAIIERVPKVERQQACHGLEILGQEEFAREAKWKWLAHPEVSRNELLRALAAWCEREP
jgi:hypothetical protein